MSKSKNIIPGGLAEGKTNSDFDQTELAAGVSVEMEHTSDRDVASEIARDHLTEDPNYYQKLKEMEAVKARKLSRRMDFQGMKISIENDKGELRHWYDVGAKKEGTTKMQYPYGYIRRTIGDDDEHVDVYVGPNESEDTVYIIRQNKAPNFDRYDEEKVMIGFESEKDAKQAYLTHYNSPKFFGSIRAMDIEDFKEKYVKKSIASPSAQQVAPPQQPGQPAAPAPGEDPMLPMFDPYDMNIQQSVQTQLASIGSMSEKDLHKLSQEVWGDGYEYRPISTHQVRAELRGWLQDQIEWIAQNPMSQMLAEQSVMPTPTEMPHSSDSSQNYGPGGNASSALFSEENLDGKLDQAELSSSSKPQGY